MAILTTAAITALITSIATKGLEKSIETTSESLTEGALKWFKSLFYKEKEPIEAVTKLIENPDSEARKNAIRSLLELDIEDNPENEKYLKEIYEKTGISKIEISNSKNVNTGDINSGGGSIHFGDNNGK
jgi:oligoendopeptidase F